MKILKIKLKKGRKKENGKMGPLETILWVGGERIKENSGGDEFN
jgi:hypothetical protein